MGNQLARTPSLRWVKSRARFPANISHCVELVRLKSTFQPLRQLAEMFREIVCYYILWWCIRWSILVSWSLLQSWQSVQRRSFQCCSRISLNWSISKMEKKNKQTNKPWKGLMATACLRPLKSCVIALRKTVFSIGGELCYKGLGQYSKHILGVWGVDWTIKPPTLFLKFPSLSSLFQEELTVASLWAPFASNLRRARLRQAMCMLNRLW